MKRVTQALLIAPDPDLHEAHLAGRCPVLFSPVQGQLTPATLAEWILADGLPVSDYQIVATIMAVQPLPESDT